MFLALVGERDLDLFVLQVATEAWGHCVAPGRLEVIGGDTPCLFSSVWTKLPTRASKMPWKFSMWVLLGRLVMALLPATQPDTHTPPLLPSRGSRRQYVAVVAGWVALDSERRQRRPS